MSRPGSLVSWTSELEFQKSTPDQNGRDDKDWGKGENEGAVGHQQAK